MGPGPGGRIDDHGAVHLERLAGDWGAQRVYGERWSDQRRIVSVLDNRDLNQVTWEQRVMAGDPKLDASQVLPDFDHAAFARQIGLLGVRVERPEDVGPAWDEALASGRPAVLEFLTDPEVPRPQRRSLRS